MPGVWSRSSFIVSSSFIKSLLSDSAALAWELNVEGKLITEMICSAGVTTKVMKTLVVLLPSSFPEWLSAKTAIIFNQNHDNETKQKKKLISPLLMTFSKVPYRDVLELPKRMLMDEEARKQHLDHPFVHFYYLCWLLKDPCISQRLSEFSWIGLT